VLKQCVGLDIFLVKLFQRGWGQEFGRIARFENIVSKTDFKKAHLLR